MTQLVKHPTLGFSSGHDLAVRGSEPCVGLYSDNAESAWNPLSLPLSAPPLLMLSPSLSE